MKALTWFDMIRLRKVYDVTTRVIYETLWARPLTVRFWRESTTCFRYLHADFRNNPNLTRTTRDGNDRFLIIYLVVLEPVPVWGNRLFLLYI